MAQKRTKAEAAPPPIVSQARRRSPSSDAAIENLRQKVLAWTEASSALPRPMGIAREK